MSQIVLLGGEGFIGKNLTDHLRVNHNCTSLGLERSIFRSVGDDVFEKFDVYKAYHKRKYDVYIHLIDHQLSGNEFESAEINLMKNLEIPSEAQLIIFSSAVVYANPTSDYGKRKIALEQFYEDYCLKKDIHLTIVRLFNIFGPYQIPFHQGSLVANILYTHLCGDIIEINDMSAKRDFIYSIDLAKIISHTISNQIYGKFDVASGEMITIRELINLLQENVIHDNIHINDKHLNETIVCPPADTSIVRAVPLHKMDSALDEAYVFYQDNLNILKKINF